MTYQASIVPVRKDGDLNVKPTVHYSWEIDDGHHQILRAEVEGNLLAITFASGQHVRLSVDQGKAVVEAVERWTRVRAE